MIASMAAICSGVRTFIFFIRMRRADNATLILPTCWRKRNLCSFQSLDAFVPAALRQFPQIKRLLHAQPYLRAIAEQPP